MVAGGGKAAAGACSFHHRIAAQNGLALWRKGRNYSAGLHVLSQRRMPSAFCDAASGGGLWVEATCDMAPVLLEEEEASEAELELPP